MLKVIASFICLLLLAPPAFSFDKIDLDSLIPTKQEVSSSSPVDADFQKALELQKKENYKEASVAYKKLLQKNPSNALAWNNLGLIQQKLQNFDVAETCYLKALKVTPDDAQAYNNLAYLRFEQGDFREAEKTYLQAIEIQPDYPLTFSNLASLYKEQGKLYKAVEFYKKAIDRAPVTDFYYRLGLLYYEMKKYDDMLETFNQGLKLNPNSPEIYYSLAVAHLYNLLGYSSEKRNSELKKTLDKLTQLSPSKATEFKNKYLLNKSIEQSE